MQVGNRLQPPKFCGSGKCPERNAIRTLRKLSSAATTAAKLFLCRDRCRKYLEFFQEIKNLTQKKNCTAARASWQTNYKHGWGTASGRSYIQQKMQKKSSKVKHLPQKGADVSFLNFFPVFSGVIWVPGEKGSTRGPGGGGVPPPAPWSAATSPVPASPPAPAALWPSPPPVGQGTHRRPLAVPPPYL